MAQVVRDVLHSLHCHVVVIDDASNDLTAREAAIGGAHVLPLAVPLGAWGALQAGFRYAARHNYPVVVTMDADGQHTPDEIKTLLDTMEQEKSDVVIGSFTERGSWQRQLAWRFFKKLTDLDFDDLTSGFRAYNKEAVELLASPDATLLDYQDVGVLLLLQKKGFVITEIKTIMLPRTTGHSRVFSTWFAVFKYLLHSIILSFCRRNNGFPDKRLSPLFSFFNRET